MVEQARNCVVVRFGAQLVVLRGLLLGDRNDEDEYQLQNVGTREQERERIRIPARNHTYRHPAQLNDDGQNQSDRCTGGVGDALAHLLRFGKLRLMHGIDVAGHRVVGNRRRVERSRLCHVAMSFSMVAICAPR